ncbi:Aste57867_1030 [Aphanomyces stellatus]|uniref:Aste57867_1030 protein n=1 Tax=Aphanomyces stellatus TaxID=120398 RepID=A0A485K4H3_9STRA|nr:hypothetical protein As57867_001029 [Aphanomyces stellatus]VFT78252.1 Aste57867_1030 [Aphanomyces stellatus]
MRAAAVASFLIGLCATVASAARRPDTDRCTAILVGAKASATGSPMTTQTNDCGDCDFRLVKVPAKTHAPGATRPIIQVGQPYPRYVGDDKGSAYTRANLDRGLFNWTNTPIIGSIPQVNHTFGYVEGVYGIMNEHQLGIGESTCTGRFWAKPVSAGGKALLDITELSRIALERTTTARAAAALMGALAEQYGYYGADWGDEASALAQAGEALTLTDPKEAWMFHILPDDTGASAIWVAQRLAETHVAAIGNQFVIRHVNLTDPANFLGSANLYEIAARHGLWNDHDEFDFTLVYALPEGTNHGSHLGMTRRVWRVLTLVNPTLKLNPHTDGYGSDYPFSVEPTKLLEPADLMRIQRDHYEGTEFDLTQGLAAGPYGDPNRYSPGSAVAPGGRFERSISVYKATYSYVTVAHPTNVNHALLWFGPYAPSETIYMPIYPQVSAVPDVAGRGSLRQFDVSTAFWLNALVGNYAARYYKFAQPVVAATQAQLEARVSQAQAAVLDRADAIFAANGTDAGVAYLTETSHGFANDAHATFTALFSSLMTQFHDGYVYSNLTSQDLGVVAMGYPQAWLDAVGYYGKSTTTPSIAASVWEVTGLVGYAVLVLLAAALGFFVGRRNVRAATGYAHIK